MRVALLEVSHWHVPLYLDALEAPGIEVVAVSDAEHVKGEAIAARFGSTLYSSAYELLEREEVDLVAVGRALLADPAWAAKIRDGRAAELLPFTPDAMKVLT